MTDRIRLDRAFLHISAVALGVLLFAVSGQAQDRREPISSALLRGNVHVVSGGSGANVSFSAGTDGILVVDSKSARYADDVLKFAAEVSPQPLRYLINTHEHPDNTGGNAQFARAGAVIVAHEEVREVLEANQRGRVHGNADALPTLTYTDFAGINFDFNGEIIEVLHVAPAHSTSNSIVHYTGSNVIHMGDLFSSNRYPAIAGGSYAAFISALNAAVQRSNFETIIVPGSGPVSDREGLIAYREMLIVLRDRVIDALDQGQELEHFIAMRPTREFDAIYGDPSHALFLPVLYEEMRARRQ